MIFVYVLVVVVTGIDLSWIVESSHGLFCECATIFSVDVYFFLQGFFRLAIGGVYIHSLVQLVICTFINYHL